MINFESSFLSVKREASQGNKLVNNLPSGKEHQKYNEGEKVCSSQYSPYKFLCGVVLGVYENNGFLYYSVRMSNGFCRTFRQKDIKPF